VNDLFYHQKKYFDAVMSLYYLSFFCLPFPFLSYLSPFLYLLILFPSPLPSFLSLFLPHFQYVSYFLIHFSPFCYPLYSYFHHGYCFLCSDHVSHYDLFVVWTEHYDLLLVKNHGFWYDVDLVSLQTESWSAAFQLQGYCKYTNNIIISTDGVVHDF